MRPSLLLEELCARTLQEVSPLVRMIAYLNQCRERISQEEIRQIINEVSLSVTDVAAYRNFHELHYTRNLVYQAPNVELFCMCWRSGQRSPIHDHHESNCTIQVLEGVMSNIDFDLLPSGYIRPVGSRELGVGDIDARSDGAIHQVANLQASGCDLVTLHVYSPPLARMNVFSLETSQSPRPGVPMEFGLAGEGI